MAKEKQHDSHALRAMDFIKKLLFILERRERSVLGLLLLVVIINSALEAVGIASVTPLIALIMDPTLIARQQTLHKIYTLFTFTSTHSFIISFGIAVAGFYVFKNAMNFLLTYLQAKYWRSCDYNIGTRLLKKYLHFPYEFYLKNNTAHLYRNITSEIGSMLNGLNQLLVLTAECLMIIFILAVLFYSNPTITLYMGLGISSIFAVIYFAVRKKIVEIGKLCQTYSGESVKIAMQAFTGIKDIKISNTENFFTKNYKKYTKLFADRVVLFEILNTLPRTAIETVTIVTIVAVLLWSYMQNQNAINTISLVAMYMIAGLRLMPSLNKILQAIMTIQKSFASTNLIYNEFVTAKNLAFEEINSSSLERLPFEKDLKINNITFGYEKNKHILENASLAIKKGTSIGIVGSSGAGKSTLIDIILGLLTTNQGEILLDNVPITKQNSRAFQKLIGYVPQAIFLMDDTIIHNIAFGLEDHAIDMKKVESAAKLAQIHSFITSLENKYNTVIGERGIRLSGGQRQRLGIARALYHEPQILLLDEATSSLDGITEHEFMEEIRKLRREKTVIIVAHRLSTVKDCDMLYFIKAGKIVATGKHEDLYANSEEYRELCKTMRIEQ